MTTSLNGGWRSSLYKPMRREKLIYDKKGFLSLPADAGRVAGSLCSMDVGQKPYVIFHIFLRNIIKKINISHGVVFTLFAVRRLCVVCSSLFCVTLSVYVWRVDGWYNPRLLCVKAGLSTGCPCVDAFSLYVVVYLLFRSEKIVLDKNNYNRYFSRYGNNR